MKAVFTRTTLTSKVVGGPSSFHVALPGKFWRATSNYLIYFFSRHPPGLLTMSESWLSIANKNLQKSSFIYLFKLNFKCVELVPAYPKESNWHDYGALSFDMFSSLWELKPIDPMGSSLLYSLYWLRTLFG
jgi:hypothetical protein